MTQQQMTKRQYIQKMYEEFNKKVEEFNIDLTKIFPAVKDLDVAELVYSYTMYFANPDIWEANILLLMQLNNIIVEKEKFPFLYEVIKQFLLKFSKIV